MAAAASCPETPFIVELLVTVLIRGSLVMLLPDSYPRLEELLSLTACFFGCMHVVMLLHPKNLGLALTWL